MAAHAVATSATWVTANLDAIPLRCQRRFPPSVPSDSVGE